MRVFRFHSGKLRRTYDESIAAANELQRGESEVYNLEPIDFGRRLAGEKDLVADPEAPQPNAIFDESGNFIIYATLLGIKVRAPTCRLGCQCSVTCKYHVCHSCRLVADKSLHPAAVA